MYLSQQISDKLSRLALKIVVMTREQGTGNREQGTLNWELLTGNRFWATLLFVTYVGFFPLNYLVTKLAKLKYIAEG
ncbi:MAG: hypothetical protein ACKPFA_25730 [Dolichospermum sp.]